MNSINRTGHRIPSVRKSCTKKQDTGTSPDGSGNSVPDTSRASETGTSRNKIPRKQTVHLQHVQKQETTAACVSFKNNRKKTDTVHKIYRVCVCTVLAETSPQALPLGAACIVSAIRHYFDRFPVPETTVQPELSVFSAESAPAADRIAALILAHHPQIVCFSLYVWNRPLLESVACIIKATAPGIILVAGGPEVTAGAVAVPEIPAVTGNIQLRQPCTNVAPLPGIPEIPVTIDNIQPVRQDIPKHPAAPAPEKNTRANSPASPATVPFNILVRGEGEAAVPAAIKDILCNRPVSSVIQGTRLPPEELKSPYLDGTLNPSAYNGGVLWELARGCPFKCAYCYESKGEKTVTYFPLERIQAELELFNRKKVRQVFVLDPTYNAEKNRALKILQMIKEKTPETFFHFECRAEFLDKELAHAFTGIACSLQIGLQSIHKTVLELVNRTFNKREFTQKIGMLNKAGVIFGFDLIYGLPGDNLEGFKESIDFAVKLYPNNLELFRLSVLPGTTLYDNRIHLGLNSQQEPPYLVESTPGFSPEELTRCEHLARATSLFYTAGRAVTWFNAVLAPLHCRPSVFFELFSRFPAAQPFLKNPACSVPEHYTVEQLQTAFIQQQYRQKHLQHLLPAALDCIRLNGALTRAVADNKKTEVRLQYHPDDILSQYTQDLPFFCSHARRFPCTISILPGKRHPQVNFIH